MKELKDTIDLMCSEDYKDRLLAEYLQLNIRLRKLLDKYINAYTYAKDMIKMQIDAMTEYGNILEIRLNMEGVEINEDYTN